MRHAIALTVVGIIFVVGAQWSVEPPKVSIQDSMPWGLKNDSGMPGDYGLTHPMWTNVSLAGGIQQSSKSTETDKRPIEKQMGKSDAQKKIFKSNPNLVFYISRTKNKNIVMYESASANQKPGDVKSSWLMLNERGQREKFGPFDSMGYGHTLKNGATNATKNLTLVALSSKKIKRPLVLQYDKDLKRVVAKTTINNKPARLFHVWVEHSSGFIPTVYHIDLHGFDDSEKYVTQRIVLKKKK
jgi:hypothetical protein